MKNIKKIGLFILLIFLSMPNVYAGNNLKCVSCGYANQLPAPVPKLTSIAFSLLIIVVPLILIAFSIVALVKATMAGKADEIMKAKGKLIKKVIATVIIFLVAGIVQFVMVKAGDASERQTILNCMNCLLYGECEEVDCNYNDTDRDTAISNSPATGSNRRPGSSSSTNLHFSSSTTFSYEFVNDGTHIPYALFTPSTANSGRKMALVIYLHGSGSVGLSPNAFRTANGPNIFDNWKMNGFDAYIVMPHLMGKFGSSWSSESAKTYIFELLDYLIQTYNIDKNNVLLTGLSLGGMGAEYLGYHGGDRFSAIAVMSGYDISIDYNELAKKKIRGYVGTRELDGSSYPFMTGKFKDAIGADNVFVVPVSHIEVAKYAFTLDENHNNNPDILEWAFGGTTSSSEPEGTAGKYYAPLQNTTYKFQNYGTTGGCGNVQVVHDIYAKVGTPIYAAMDGTAEFSQNYCSSKGELYSYGNKIKLTGSDGTYVIYGHLSKFPDKIEQQNAGKLITKTCPKMSDGSAPCGAGACPGGTTNKVVGSYTVKKGDIIGYTGDTGNSLGPHLHVEIHENGKCISNLNEAFGME